MKTTAMMICLVSLLALGCEGDKQRSEADLPSTDDSAQIGAMPAVEDASQATNNEGVEGGQPQTTMPQAPSAPPPVEAPPAVQAMSGEQVFKKYCFACHMTGAANAPKVGDAEAWSPRIEKGMEALVVSSIEGVPGTAMAPKGSCGACTEDELQAAIEFMVRQSR